MATNDTQFSEGKTDRNYLNKRLKNFNKMIEYAELKTCYREYILKYFGEKYSFI